MNLLVLPLLPLIPVTARWLEEQEAIILKHGQPLTPSQLIDAKKAGVAYPEKIRVQFVHRIKAPEPFLLNWGCKLANAFGPDVGGITLRYGIRIRSDLRSYRKNQSLWTHEMAHVGQYERYGSIHAFLVDYLAECIYPGYPHGPLEKQADGRAAKIVHR